MASSFNAALGVSRKVRFMVCARSPPREHVATAVASSPFAAALPLKAVDLTIHRLFFGPSDLFFGPSDLLWIPAALHSLPFKAQVSQR